MRLWIDDERPIPDNYTHWAKSSQEAIDLLERQLFSSRSLQLISFDHDLGGTTSDDTSRPVLMWMIENECWPTEIRVHTANPVGRDFLIGTAKRYMPPTTFINPHNPYEGWM